MTQADPRKEYNTRVSKLRTERSGFFSHWQELNRFLSPRGFRALSTETNKGGKKYNDIINSTATMALDTLASGMMAGITSPARPWFRLGTDDLELMEYGPVKEWLSRVERLLREIFNRSNFYTAMHTAYGHLGGYGTAAVFALDDYEDVIRFYPQSLGTYCLAANGRGDVDTIYREFPMTVGNVVEAFGRDKVSRTVLDQFNRGAVDNWVEVVHLVEPRTRIVPGRRDNLNMPFRSVYYEKGGDGRLLSESGFQEFAAFCPRWHIEGSDVYASDCPGMRALGDVKQLQVQVKRKAEAIDKVVRPPMTAPSGLRNKASSILPGGITYIDVAQGQQGFTPAFQINPYLGDLKEDIRETQAIIRTAFYADLFQMITLSDRRQITAREIEERHEEKLLTLGPVLERLHSELLDPVIDRTFAIALRAGIIPDPPREIQGQPLRVEYISILAQAQRAIGLGSLERLAGFVGNLAAVKPEVLDKFDADQAVDEYAEMLGTPPKVVVPDDKVAETRALRAQQQQALQQQAIAQQAVAGAKDLSQTDTEGKNALTDILGI